LLIAGTSLDDRFAVKFAVRAPIIFWSAPEDFQGYAANRAASMSIGFNRKAVHAVA
jgi:hypothetical protein